MSQPDRIPPIVQRPVVQRFKLVDPFLTGMAFGFGMLLASFLVSLAIGALAGLVMLTLGISLSR